MRAWGGVLGAGRDASSRPSQTKQRAWTTTPSKRHTHGWWRPPRSDPRVGGPKPHDGMAFPRRFQPRVSCVFLVSQPWTKIETWEQLLPRLDWIGPAPTAKARTRVCARAFFGRRHAQKPACHKRVEQPINYILTNPTRTHTNKQRDSKQESHAPAVRVRRAPAGAVCDRRRGPAGAAGERPPWHRDVKGRARYPAQFAGRHLRGRH